MTHSDTSRPVVLLVHHDAETRRDLTSDMNVWCDSSLEILPAANDREAYDWITSKKDISERLAAVVAHEGCEFNVREFLLGLRPNAPGTALAILTCKENNALDKDIFEFNEAPEVLELALEELFFAWNPTDPLLEIHGPKEGHEERAFRHFLYLNGIPYRWDGESNSTEVEVRIQGHLFPGPFPPSPGEIYTALGMIPEPQRPLDYPYDLVIVGGGPAGLSAALSASVNYGLRPLVIESKRPGGTAATSINLIENYLGFPGGISGTNLAKLALQQMRDLDIDWRPTMTARKLMKEDRGRYRIQVGDTVEEFISAGMVLLACGKVELRLPLPSEERRIETGLLNRGIYYGAQICHRDPGNHVVIVGGGDSAGQVALLLAKRGSASVTIVTPFGLTMAKPLAREVRHKVNVLPHHEVSGFLGVEHLTGVKVRDRESAEAPTTLAASSAYILIGGESNTKWLRESEEKVELSEEESVKTDVYLEYGHLPRMLSVSSPLKRLSQLTRYPRGIRRLRRKPYTFETNLPGVFAAGDVRVAALGRVGQAVGQGVAAVASMDRYLNEKHRHRSVLADPTSVAYMRHRILEKMK
ncbi:NAD(P)/FAD-dependent oxidoreductase [Streptomyces sp. NRRL S-337]|uniref:NAD(P)/FAD-dependent oxidoreductase n=1 Tax=Streptomyces sp. NRRL S-337 TaxID=1463900 RepID=UPI00099DD7E6|nr:NAD(P)/FAD-dependent oxidoreductase [Streptomyces sp. NRRL S-337]